MSDSKQTERKINANIDSFSADAQQEVTRLRKEIDDLRARARPKVQEAENFLSSPQVSGFIGGFVAATAVILGYAKYNGGIRL